MKRKGRDGIPRNTHLLPLLYYFHIVIDSLYKSVDRRAGKNEREDTWAFRQLLIVPELYSNPIYGEMHA